MQYLTIVLGAGASVPYGFPTGEELVVRLIDRISYHKQNTQEAALQARGIQEPKNLPIGDLQFLNSLQEMADTLRLYDPVSIDSYLHKHYASDENGLKLYKQLIALEMLYCFIDAQRGMKFGKNNQENWLRFIIPELLAIFDRNKRDPKTKCPIKFITFNYDLSLEFYIERIIRSSKIHTPEEKDNFLQWVGSSIVHVYGHIGSVKWLGFSNVSTSQDWELFLAALNQDFYSSIFNSPHADKISNTSKVWHAAQKFGAGIELIGSRTNVSVMREIEQWLYNTKTLLFTGYAFHPDNNNILQLSKRGAAIPSVILGLFGATRREKMAARELFVEAHGQNNQIVRRIKIENENHPRPEFDSPWIMEFDLKTYPLLRNELVLSQLYYS